MMDRMEAIERIAYRKLVENLKANAALRRREVLRKRAMEVRAMTIALQATADTWAYEDFLAAGGERGTYRGRVPPISVRLTVLDGWGHWSQWQSLRQIAWRAAVSGEPLYTGRSHPP
jgi:hypothetical protein